jgi:hypothetical protein
MMDDAGQNLPKIGPDYYFARFIRPFPGILIT